MSIACLDDCVELWFKGSSSNKETIDIWLCDKLCSVLCIC